MPWQKGQSGNPKGRAAPGDELTRLVRATLRRHVSAEDKRSKKQAVAEKLVELALAGDVTALKFLFDRIDGKVPEPVDLAGDMIVRQYVGVDVDEV